MLVKIFTLSFDQSKQQFDAKIFDEFSANKKINQVNDYFFSQGNATYLCLIVKYELVTDEPKKMVPSSIPSRNSEFKIEFKDEEMKLFNELRSWRAKVCKDEGVPPYIILNNKQLARIVEIKPLTKTALDEVDGIGKIKVEKYASAILEIVSKFLQQRSDPGSGKEVAVATEGGK